MLLTMKVILNFVLGICSDLQSQMVNLVCNDCGDGEERQFIS